MRSFKELAPGTHKSQHSTGGGGRMADSSIYVESGHPIQKILLNDDYEWSSGHIQTGGFWDLALDMYKHQHNTVVFQIHYCPF